MTDDQIKHMAQRFLGWKLPQPFRPDAGISFKPEYNVEYNAKHGRPPNRHEPTGTNLWGYTEAVEMVRHMVEGLAVDQNAIERHEAFRQEVSEAVRDYYSEAPASLQVSPLKRFIIEPVDPLVEAATQILLNDGIERTTRQAEAIKSGNAGQDKIALIVEGIKRGIEIAKGED